jgi:hypothetical protein
MLQRYRVGQIGGPVHALTHSLACKAHRETTGLYSGCTCILLYNNHLIPAALSIKPEPSSRPPCDHPNSVTHSLSTPSELDPSPAARAEPLTACCDRARGLCKRSLRQGDDRAATRFKV